MILIPAIDIKDKKCVRLYKGDFNKKKIYSDSPKDIALKWESYGASLIHLVDLDGALDGKSSNYDVIKDISSSVKCDLQIGGGIRNIETIDSYLKLGIKRVILGTSAFKDPNFLKEALKKYPHNISVGLDIKEGKVAIQGWNQKTACYPFHTIKRDVFKHNLIIPINSKITNTKIMLIFKVLRKGFS